MAESQGVGIDIGIVPVGICNNVGREFFGSTDQCVMVLFNGKGSPQGRRLTEVIWR